MSNPMQQQIDRVAQTYPLSSLVVDGDLWSWLDTGGDGPAVVLLHGSAANAFMFVRTIGSLGRRLRLVAVSIPALWEPSRFAEGLRRVMDHVRLASPVIAGSSMGAYLAPFFASRYPERVGALLLGNGFVDAGDLAANPLFDRARIESCSPEAFQREWAGRVGTAPESDLKVLQQYMLAQKPAEALHAHFLAVVRARACPPVALPLSAITVLSCEDDPVIPAATRERVKGQFPGARAVSLATGGHYPHVLNTDAYEEVLLTTCGQDRNLSGRPLNA